MKLGDGHLFIDGKSFGTLHDVQIEIDGEKLLPIFNDLDRFGHESYMATGICKLFDVPFRLILEMQKARPDRRRIGRIKRDWRRGGRKPR